VLLKRIALLKTAVKNKNRVEFKLKAMFKMLFLAGIATTLFAETENVFAQASYKFDFGTGKVAGGFKQVVATTKYNDAQGYGFDYNSQVTALDRGGNDALTSDFCTSNSPFFFSVKVPEGSYKVSVTLGDLWQNSITTIKAESRRLMIKEIKTIPGKFTTVSFMVNIRDSLLPNGQKVILKPREINQLDWDNKLTLEFSNSRPCVDAIEIQKVENATTVYLTGNSTVTDQQLEPWACWGQMIPSFFKSDQIVIANHAVSGSTLGAFIAHKRLEKIMNVIKPGDYLFVEFAHNDQKPGAHEKPYATYNALLKRFIDSARAHKAIPVLVTSTCRRFFDSTGHIENTLGEYPTAMRYEAKKDGVALIDLNAMSAELFNVFGPEKSKQLFVQFPSGTFPGQLNPLADNTHFNDFGAYELAKCMVNGIRNSKLAIAKYLKGDATFNPPHPDDIKKWDLPLTPMYTSIKPLGN
jgi:lysophospholipase L1-like esterase